MKRSLEATYLFKKEKIPKHIIQNSLSQILMRSLFIWFLKEQKLKNKHQSKFFDPSLWREPLRDNFYLSILKEALIGSEGNIRDKSEFLRTHLDLSHSDLDIFRGINDRYIAYSDSIFSNKSKDGLFDLLDSYDYVSEDSYFNFQNLKEKI